MEAIREITGEGLLPHVYLLDGTTLLGYIRRGEGQPEFFRVPIKNFDKRGRKFEKADIRMFVEKS